MLWSMYLLTEDIGLKKKKKTVSILSWVQLDF